MPFMTFLQTLYVQTCKKYGVRYIRFAYTPETNCKFPLDFKTFKIIVFYSPMSPRHGFCLYNTAGLFLGYNSNFHFSQYSILGGRGDNWLSSNESTYLIEELPLLVVV